VALTRDDGLRNRVELVRCTSCNARAWHLDGVAVGKGEALGALSAIYASGRPRANRPTARPRPARRTAPAADFSDLLSGWQVFGS
jgi:hypothetical protein